MRAIDPIRRESTDDTVGDPYNIFYNEDGICLPRRKVPKDRTFRPKGQKRTINQYNVPRCTR